MKAKAIKVAVFIKRIFLIGLTLGLLSMVWKLEMLRQRGRAFSHTCVKLLELQLVSAEDKMAKAADVFQYASAHGMKGASAPQSGAVLKGLLTLNSYMEEVAWVAGNGNQAYVLGREGSAIVSKNDNSLLKNNSIYEAHNKGKVVISSLEYVNSRAPIFYLSYPLDGQEGGFLVTRVNLWEFFKLPTALAQDMLGNSFDFEVRSKQGQLLAHRVHAPDPLGKMVTRFMIGKSSLERLGVEIRLIPTRQAVREALAPGRLLWYCLSIAVLLCLIL